MYNRRLETALINGAGSGMGRATAQRLSREGFRVFVSDLNEAKVQETAKIVNQAGGQAEAVTVDVADSSAVADMFDQLRKKTERLDLMVQCAAILGEHALVEDMDDRNWHRQMSVNLDGTFFCCREAVRWMRDTGGGRIILFSSISSLRPVPGRVHYSISKAGVNMLTKTLAAETAGHNIRVNAIAPGYVKTPMLSDVAAEMKEWALENTPLKRMANPEEIAGIVAFLASPAADFFTGQIISPNGGIFI